MAWAVGIWGPEGSMDRILAMSLVGAGPCNVFGPGMIGGALESFARGSRAKAEGNSSKGAAARGTRSASAGSGGKCAAERTGDEKEANNGASANVTRSSCPALDQKFYFVDAVVAPY